MRFSAVTAAIILASTAIAHPGHDHSKEVAERAEFMKTGKRGLGQCSEKMKARGLEARAVRRRADIMKTERQKRGISTTAPFLKARDLDTVLATSHLSNVTYDQYTDLDTIFSGNSSCILSPEVTQGPYLVSGEYVRDNIIETQEGIEMILDIQIIDVATCDPVIDSMIEIWSCNSTGVYSGIQAQGNGDSSDASNLNATFLRGLQPTEDDGVAQFTTLIPGYYTSRAPHIHLLAHFNGTIQTNETYTGGYVSHVGQLFFDQDLITQVNEISPYSTSTQQFTTNADDSILAQEADDGIDPVVEYSLLGDTLEDGIFAWISVGIDLTVEKTLTAAASLYETGGVEN